jgi:hypothetical protein
LTSGSGFEKEPDMRWVACFLGFSALAAGCVLEDRPVGTGGTGGNGCGTCEDPTPVCNPGSGQCVECRQGQVDYCTTRSLLCDTERFECVACVGDSDCTAVTAAKCDPELQECVPCDADRQCDDVEGFPGVSNACNDEGECVDCTPASEAESCPGQRSCNPATEQCTETRVGSLDVCEACVADSECGVDNQPSADYRCVPMYYPAPPNRFPDQDTGFCLKTTEGGCERPFSITLFDRPTLTDPLSQDDYCGMNELLVACPAVRALILDVQCPGGTPEECPTSGLCEKVGDLDDRCTYACDVDQQCLPVGNPANPNPGSRCNNYCGG